MYELKKKIGKVLTSKSVGTGPLSYEKRIYRAAVSERLRNTVLVETPNMSQQIISPLLAQSLIPRCVQGNEWNTY